MAMIYGSKGSKILGRGLPPHYKYPTLQFSVSPVQTDVHYCFLRRDLSVFTIRCRAVLIGGDRDALVGSPFFYPSPVDPSLPARTESATVPPRLLSRWVAGCLGKNE